MANDLGEWLNGLWTKTRPTTPPDMYLIHRFLASDRLLAPAARAIGRDINVRQHGDLAYRTWQGLLPRSMSAPTLTYAAPKRAAAAERLTVAMMAATGDRRDVVEMHQAIVAQCGRLADLYREYGLPSPTADAADTPPPSPPVAAPTRSRKRKTKTKSPPPTGGGLLENL